jgi:two-component system, LytTR family, response regulator
MNINCIIIEDEPLAVIKLKGFIEQVSYLNLCKSFDSGIEAIGFIKTNEPDLIFLDIEMKNFTGIQLLETLDKLPKIIITTAYEKYALKGYDLQVSDYLLKPIIFERFIKACDKVYNEIQLGTTKQYPDQIFINTEYRLEGVKNESILYIQGMGDYRKIVTEHKSIMTLQTFKELQKILNPNNFCRVHNSYIVAINKIDKIERNRIIIKNQHIPISDSYSHEFYKRIGK